MPRSKRRRTTRADTRLALDKRLGQIRAEIARLKRDRAAVKRDEFEEISKSLKQLQENTDSLFEHTKSLATQFTRIAQIQHEVDELRRAMKKAKLLD